MISRDSLRFFAEKKQTIMTFLTFFAYKLREITIFIAFLQFFKEMYAKNAICDY